MRSVLGVVGPKQVTAATDAALLLSISWSPERTVEPNFVYRVSQRGSVASGSGHPVRTPRNEPGLSPRSDPPDAQNRS